MFYQTTYPSSVGIITLACDKNSLVGAWIEGQKYHGGKILQQTVQKDETEIFVSVKKWLHRYFAGEKPDISELSLHPAGSEFRREVWHILCGIPYGKVITYKDIAKKMAEKMNRASMSAQAVGGAVGHNPISIIIPCHRVVGSNGSLTGYAGGIHTKIKLLELEGADMSRLSMPEKGSAQA